MAATNKPPKIPGLACILIVTFFFGALLFRLALWGGCCLARLADLGVKETESATASV
jgi:hypothetical protein